MHACLLQQDSNITLPTLDNLYVARESLSHADEIPTDLAEFCSLSNSYWFEEANDRELLNDRCLLKGWKLTVILSGQFSKKRGSYAKYGGHFR